MMHGSHSRKLEQIVVLRAVAAILVVATHSVIYGCSIKAFQGFPKIPYYPFFSGAFGVDIFFVLSGFILSFAASSSNRGALAFFRDRFIRIYPAYFATFACALAIGWFKHREDGWPWSLSSVIRSGLLISDIDSSGHIESIVGVSWTLSYEIVFYSIFAVSLTFFRRTNITFCLCAFLVIVLTGSAYGSLFFGNPIVFEFIFGMLVFYFYKRNSASFQKYVWPSCVGIFISASAVYFKSWHGFEDKLATDRSLVLGLPATLVLICFLGLNVKSFPRILIFLGEASYSLYLTHFIIAFPILGYLARSSWLERQLSSLRVAGLALFSITCFSFSILIASLFFKVIEKPATRYLRSKFETYSADHPRRPEAV